MGESGAACSNSAGRIISAGNSCCIGSVIDPSIAVDCAEAIPCVDNATDVEANTIEPDGSANLGRSCLYRGSSCESSTAVSGWACCVKSRGSASGWSSSNSNISGLEVSAKELSGGDGAEGEDGESLEHLICLFESYLIDYKQLILFSLSS